jgi:hypothetical protein
MDMGDSMPMGDGSTAPLNASGVDFSDPDQAANFLGEILDDTVFQVDANLHARYFWYGVCAVIAVCAFFNLAQKATSIFRYGNRGQRQLWVTTNRVLQDARCCCQPTAACVPFQSHLQSPRYHHGHLPRSIVRPVHT